MKTNHILALIFAALLASTATAQQAFLTFLHNSADTTLRYVDVYVTQSGQTTKVDNLEYQKADNFNTAIVFGGFECYVDVAPANSNSKDEAIATLTFTPEADAGYEIEFRGNAGDGWVPNPDGASTGLSISQVKVPYVDPVVGEVAVMFSHGSTDLEACDVYVRGNSTPLFTNVKYGMFTDTFKKVKRQRQTIDLTKTGDKTKVLASFEVDLAFGSSNIVVLTVSGYKTPADNHASPNALSMLTVQEDGNVQVFPLLSGSQTARVQVIHNSADPSLAMVDIYVNGTKAIDNLGFKRATAFADFPAGADMQVAFAPASSTGIKDTLLSLPLEQFRPGRSYHLIIQGVRDTSKFRGAATSTNLSLTILEKDGALEKGTKAGETSIRSVHGVIDLAGVDLVIGSTSLAANMVFNSVAPEYINVVGTQTDTIWAVEAGTSKKIRGWIADLRGSERAVVAALSGVVGPDSNQNAEEYELILVDANGSSNDRLVKVDTSGTVGSITDLVPSTLWTVAPNPSTSYTSITIPLPLGLQGLQGAMATVYSTSGATMASVPMLVDGASIQGKLTTSQFAPGAYLVQVTAGDQVVGTTRIVVAR